MPSHQGDESVGKLIVINSCVFSSISDGGFKESLNSPAHIPEGTLKSHQPLLL